MRKALRGMKNVVYQFSPIELKVREATNNDRFLVSSTSLGEIARATHDYQEYPMLFAMLWKRLTDLEHVMHVQKALHVVEYLLRHGAERFISDAKRRARDIAALQKYKHYDEQNQDDAREARARAKAVYALLMDDQLLAQERGKSARLASEGRLGGMGTYESDPHAEAAARYEQDVYGDDEPAAAAPVRRAPAAASASAGGAPRSAVMRRRSVDEDPFATPVIPAAVGGAPVKPRERAAPTPAAAAGKRSAAPAPAALDVEEPEDDEEAAAAEAKRVKKEKKKKKKEEEARKAAAEAAGAQQQQPTKRLGGGGGAAGASSAAPAASHRTTSFDLTAYAPGSAGNGAGGEIDILTGQAHGFAAAPGQDGEDALEDLFASSTLTDEQVSSPLFYSGNPFRSPIPQGTEGEEEEAEGQAVPQQQQGQGQQQRGSHHHNNSNNHALSPTVGLVNLNDLTAPRVDRNRENNSVDSGVSMSMMRSIQPLGSPAQQQQQSQQPSQDDFHSASNKRRSNVPSSVPFGAGAAAMYPGMGPMQPQPGMMQPMMGGGGYGMPYNPQQQAMYPGMPYGGGYGGGMPPQHAGMQMYGQMGGQQPMLALMAPGMGSGGMAPMQPYQQPPPQQFYGGAASSSPSHTFTQMRQAPTRGAHSGPIIFDVQAAAPEQQQQQQSNGNGMQQHRQGGDAQYQSFYGGAKNGAQQLQQRQH